LTCYIFSTPEPCVIWMSLSLTHTLIDYLFFLFFLLLFIFLSLSLSFWRGILRWRRPISTRPKHPGLDFSCFHSVACLKRYQKKKRKQKYISQFYFFNFNFSYFDNYNRIFSYYNPLLFLNFSKNISTSNLFSLSDCCSSVFCYRSSQCPPSPEANGVASPNQFKE
jgi:hypothetical protein